MILNFSDPAQGRAHFLLLINLGSLLKRKLKSYFYKQEQPEEKLFFLI